MENVEVAKILNDYADLLDIKGENPFRVRSYRKVAQSIEHSSRPLAELIEDDADLTTLPGIGTSMADHLREIIETGTLSAFQTLQKKVPGTLVVLLRLEGLGPKKVKTLYHELGITSITELRTALNSGEVETLPGFGKTTAHKLRQSLKEFDRHRQRFKLVDVEQLIRPFLDYMRKAPGIEKLEVAGSFRRRKETIGDVDVLIACDKPEPVMKYFQKFSSVKRVENAGTTKGTILLQSGLKVDLRLLHRNAFGAALHYFTGSKAHNIAIRQLGVGKGLRISEYGVFRVSKTKGATKTRKTREHRIGGSAEMDVFQAVGLSWIAPELRENQGEIEKAQKNNLPKLIELKDIRGNLHMHSTWSDGQNTIEEMVRACKDLGYQYCAMTDHSRSTRIAGGLDIKDLKNQWKEINTIRKRLKGIRLLASAEVDILPDGDLDYPDHILENLDIVVASIHSHLTMSKRDMTKRIIKAICHQAVDIIGHPTQRQINDRDPYALDFEEIFRAARDHDVALELNAQPIRLDLSDVYVRRAKEIDVKIAINSDAHSVENLQFMRYGIDQARRGWLEKENVVNTLPWNTLKQWLHRRR